jgi:hypothetical protein
MQVSNEGSIPSDEWVLDEWDLELSNEDVACLQEIEKKASNYCMSDWMMTQISQRPSRTKLCHNH